MESLTKVTKPLYKTNRIARLNKAVFILSLKLVSVTFIFPFVIADDLHAPNRTGKIPFFAQWMRLVILLRKAGNYYKDEFSFIALGDAYKALNQPQKAETHYQLAANMVPHKFYPLYLLANLYRETGQREKAVALARQLLNKKIKVPSQAIEEIKEKMREVINNYSHTSDETQNKIKKGKNYVKRCTTGIEHQFW